MEICKACVMLEGLNKGKPKLGIGKSSKALQHMDSQNGIVTIQNKNIDF
jgi:hypothetical protein